MKDSEAARFLESVPVPKFTWLDRCRGDRRLTANFIKGMGYRAEDVQAKEEQSESKETEA